MLLFCNPPSYDVSFYDELRDVMKSFDSHMETILYGDYNINWLNKNNKQKLKMMMSKLNFQQIIKGPTRITRNTKTLIDMIFTNKPDQITKTFNLLTGLSDHNMTLAVKKLTKKRLQYFGSSNADRVKMVIPKSKIVQFERDFGNINWDQLTEIDDLDVCCNSMTTTLVKLIAKYTK